MGLFKRHDQTGLEYGIEREHGGGVVTVVYKRSDDKLFVDVLRGGVLLGSCPGDNRESAIHTFVQGD